MGVCNIMINAIKLWWRLITNWSSPAVVPLDWKYKTMSEQESKQLIRLYGMQELPSYQLWEFNCTDFAWVFKGLSSKQRLKPTGFVIGLRTWKLHCWNVVVTGEKVTWIEPQSGNTWKGLNTKYIPLVVII